MPLQATLLTTPQPTGAAYGERLRVALVALSTDLAIERDFHFLAGVQGADEIAIFTSRVKLQTPNTEATFRALERELPDIAGLIIPSSRLDVAVFGCTAASMLIGSDSIEAAVRRSRPGLPVTNPAAGALAALRAAGARSIAMLTPYTPSVTTAALDFMERSGINVLSAACLGVDLDDSHARIAEDVLLRSALALDWHGADAIFLSCTATRALNVIEPLESATGKLVVTSNQAAYWHALRRGGLTGPVRGIGRLFDLPR